MGPKKAPGKDSTIFPAKLGIWFTRNNGNKGVTINDYALSHSHHWSNRSETAKPITAKHYNTTTAQKKKNLPLQNFMSFESCKEAQCKYTAP